MAIKQTAGRDALGEFAPKFAQLNDDVLFGEVWSREAQLSLRDRSLITVTALMAQGLGGMTRSTVGGVCALIVLFMMLSSVLSITSMAINQVEWLGTLSYLTPDTAMNHFLGAGIESSSQSTLAAAVKPNYWIPDWWQSGLILLAWAAAAWAGGLIVTKKADIK